MQPRKASIKETGEELSQDQWKRFDAAVAQAKAERPKTEPYERDEAMARRLQAGPRDSDA